MKSHYDYMLIYPDTFAQAGCNIQGNIGFDKDSQWSVSLLAMLQPSSIVVIQIAVNTL